jgi:hypothetical protein
MPAAMPASAKAWREILTTRNQVRKISLTWLRAACKQLKASGRGDDMLRPALEQCVFTKLKLAPKECSFDGKRPHEAASPDDAAGTTKPTPKSTPKPPKPPKPADEPEWIEAIDSSSDRTYWYNPSTKVSTYENPRQTVPESAVVARRPSGLSLDLPSSGGFVSQMQSMAASLSASGAAVTLNAPGAFAAGCNVYMMPPPQQQQQQQEQQHHHHATPHHLALAPPGPPQATPHCQPPAVAPPPPQHHHQQQHPQAPPMYPQRY